MTATEVPPTASCSDRVRETTRDRPVPSQADSPGRVEEVLRSLPSHGWTDGWIGRRDRALLVLSQMARLSYENIAALTAGDLTVAGGSATIRTAGGTTTLGDVADGMLCGPCALARWVQALDLTVVYPDGRVIAAVIARAVPLTPDSPHLCHSNNAMTEITRRVTLLPPIDRWGHPARARIPSALPGVRALGNTRRDFVPIQQAPHRPPTATHTGAHRAHALQNRVEQLLNGSAR
jgi:hypothetical protein